MVLPQSLSAYAGISAATFHPPDAVSGKVPLVFRWLEGVRRPDAPEKRNQGLALAALYSWRVSQRPGGVGGSGGVPCSLRVWKVLDGFAAE